MIDLEARFEAALSKFDGENFDQLSEIDRILVTIWWIEAEVNNGGFDQYYFNSAGNEAYFAPVALAMIGAHRMSEIAVEANARFGSDGPSRSREERQAQLDRLTADGEEPWEGLDEAFQAYPDDVGMLTRQFLQAGSHSE